MMSVLVSLHLLAAVIWVGGMFFAYVCLRPSAASVLEPPFRLRLWRQVFKRFFPWVWAAVLLLPVTGHGMIAMFGGFAAVGLHVHIMLGLGYLMIALFMHVFFAPYKHLQRACDAEDWPAAGKRLNQIRQIIAVNLSVGLVVVLVAAAGRYV